MTFQPLLGAIWQGMEVANGSSHVRRVSDLTGETLVQRGIWQCLEGRAPSRPLSSKIPNGHDGAWPSKLRQCAQTGSFDFLRGVMVHLKQSPPTAITMEGEPCESYD